jgi:hypothetical protein
MKCDVAYVEVPPIDVVTAVPLSGNYFFKASILLKVDIK